MKLVVCGDPELGLGLGLALGELGAALRGRRHEVVEFLAGDVERTDLHPEHWHKSRDPDVAARFRALCDAERPDLVLVCHWRRLTRDLLALAARARVPGVLFAVGEAGTCLLPERVRPDTGEPCDAPLAGLQCIRCAGRGPVRADWVPLEQQFLVYAELERDLARELELARCVVFPDAESRARLERLFPRYAEVRGSETLAARDDWAGLARILERVAAAGVTLDAPEDSPPEADWYQERMLRFARDEWDRRCAEQD